MNIKIHAQIADMNGDSMGQSGLNLYKQVTKTEILSALKKNQGIMTYTARELGISYNTLKKYTDMDPELRDALKQQRQEYIEGRKDKAEKVLDYLIGNLKNNPKLAFNSAVYVLNNQGKDRGYAHPQASDTTIKDSFTEWQKHQEMRDDAT